MTTPKDIVTILALIGVAGCGSNATVDADASMGPDAAPILAHGGVRVTFSPPRSTVFFWAGFEILDWRETLLDTSGPCRLMQFAGARLAGAGTVTIELDGVDPQIFEWMGYYEETAVPFEPMEGAMVQVTASGGEVPAFAGSVQMPPPLLGVSMPSEGANISKSGDAITLAWSPHPSNETIHAVLINNAPSIAILCDVPDATGSLTIPPGLLNQVPEGDVIILVERANRTTVDLPGYDIQVVADSTWARGANLVP